GERVWFDAARHDRAPAPMIPANGVPRLPRGGRLGRSPSNTLGAMTILARDCDTLRYTDARSVEYNAALRVGRIATLHGYTRARLPLTHRRIPDDATALLRRAPVCAFVPAP